MRTSIIIMAAGLAMASAGCKKAGPAAAPVTEAEALKIAESTEAEYGRGDAAKIMAHYASDAVAFDPAHADPTSDPKVLTGWTSEFVSMQPDAFQVGNRTIQLVGPDSFVSSGIARFTVAAGAARPQVGVRFSQVYKRQKDGGWKIVHEHMSMPPAAAGNGQR